MNESGNYQWNESYPNEERLRKDIDLQYLWVSTTSANDSESIVIDTETQAENYFTAPVEQQSKEIAGFCAITTDQDPEYGECFDITIAAIVPHRLAVHPNFRRQGIAQTFLSKAESLAKERGLKYIRVDTNKENGSMRRIFEELNYVYAGEISLPGKPPGMRFACYHKEIN